jgi:uncharacterized membrane protein YgdD (TMEM256/DUF423 family)
MGFYPTGSLYIKELLESLLGQISIAGYMLISGWHLVLYKPLVVVEP